MTARRQSPANQHITATLPLFNNYLSPKVSYRYDSLGSTNAAAVAAIHGGNPPEHGDVFLTYAQTTGRGQGDNTWHASPGANLTLSLVVYPDRLTADRLFSLSQWAALAIADTVQHFLGSTQGGSVRVKWPNDVYVGDRKIAGILIQNGLRGNNVNWSVIGVGLNVNENDFPASLTTKATSLRQITGQQFDLARVLAKLLQLFSTFYPFCFPDPPTGFILAEGYHNSLYRRDVPSSFVLKETGQEFNGIIRGVDEHGRLRVEQTVGRESVFAVGEVTLVR